MCKQHLSTMQIISSDRTLIDLSEFIPIFCRLFFLLGKFFLMWSGDAEPYSEYDDVPQKETRGPVRDPHNFFYYDKGSYYVPQEPGDMDPWHWRKVNVASGYVADNTGVRRKNIGTFVGKSLSIESKGRKLYFTILDLHYFEDRFTFEFSISSDPGDVAPLRRQYSIKANSTHHALDNFILVIMNYMENNVSVSDMELY